MAENDGTSVAHRIRAGIVFASWAADRFALIVCLGLLATLVSTVFVSVLVRYLGLFHGSFAWIDESSRFLFIWLSLMAASRAYYLYQHIIIDVLVRLFPLKVQFALDIVSTVASALFFLVVLVQGYRLASLSFDQTSSALEMPMAYVFAALPLTAFIMIIHSLGRLVQLDYDAWQRRVQQRLV